jgi:hypothetical protein
MICLRCAELRDLRSHGRCPACGSALSDRTDRSLEAFVAARLGRQLERWVEGGALSRSQADRLWASVAAPSSPEALADAPVPVEPASPRVRAVAAGAHAHAANDDTHDDTHEDTHGGAYDGASDDAEETRAGESALGVEAGQAVFAAGAAGETLGGAVEALAALDAPPREPGRWETEVWPLLREQVGWFLGVLLVLAGSAMWLRSMWSDNEGATRLSIVAGAFFAYHAAFVGLGRLVVGRAPLAGAVLGGLGLGLLPVVYAVLGQLVGTSPLVGLPLTLALSAGVAGMLGPAARALGGLSRPELLRALLPALLAHVLLAWPAADGWARAAVPLVGLVPVLLAARRWGQGEEGAGAALSATLYVAVALLAAALLGGGEAVGAGALASEAAPGVGALLWFTLLLAALAPALSTPGRQERWPRGAPVLLVLAHAGLTAAVLAALPLSASLGAGGAGDAGDAVARGALFLVAAVAAGSFRGAARHLHRAVHLAVPATGAAGVLGVWLVTDARGGWAVGLALAVADALHHATRVQGRARRALVAWGAVGGLLVPLLAVLQLQDVPDTQAMAVLAASLVALAAHTAAARALPALHALGGVAATLTGLAALGAPLLPLEGFPVLLLVGAGYGVLARLLRPSPAGAGAGAGAGHPLDDVSLGAASLAQLLALLLPLPALPSLLGGGGWDGARLQLGGMLLAAAALLLVRAARDGSRLVSLLGALGLARAVWAVTAPEGHAQAALVLAATALGLLLLAQAQGLVRGEASARRVLLGAVPLPFPASGAGLWADALATAGLAAAALAGVRVVGFLVDPTLPERGSALLAAWLLVAVAAVGFLARSTRGLHLRGAEAWLALLGGAAVLASSVNRLGRPLPPADMAWRMVLVTAGVALAARVLERVGPRLARALERPAAGPRYAWVAHAGVGVLAGVQVLRALWLSEGEVVRGLLCVPPLLPLGAALALLLLRRAVRHPFLVEGAFALGLLGAAVVGVQRALLGPAMVPLTPPGADWVPRTSEAASVAGGSLLPAGLTLLDVTVRAVQGVGVAAVLLAVLALVLRAAAGLEGLVRLPTRLLAALGLALGVPGLQQREPSEAAVTPHAAEAAVRWALRAATLVALAGVWQPQPPATGLVLATGAVLLLSGVRWPFAPLLGTSLLLGVHGAAQAAPRVPAWAAVALGALGVGAAALTLLRVRGRPGRRKVLRALGGLGALVSLGTGLLYALAVGGPTSLSEAGPVLLAAALDGLAGGLPLPWGVALCLALWGVAQALLGLAATPGGGRASAATAWGAWGLAGVLQAFALAVAAFPAPRLPDALSGAPALALAALALLATAAAEALAPARPGLAAGSRTARDGLLLLAGALLALFIGLPPGLPVETGVGLGLLAVGLAGAASLRAAWRERAPRHVYGVQLAVTAAYGVARTRLASAWPPEVDAVAALVLAFALVGVTVAARRAGLPPVAEATRRFAALLPVAAALLLPGGASSQVALAAAASSVLYAALAFAERSRLYGSLAAVAGNLALLVATLASGLEGVELLLAPFGLLVICLGQLFGSTLAPAARQGVRVAGGLLLYAPAALKLTLEVGSAASPTYAVAFAGVCLLGVAAGLVFQVRAYLALGLAFFTLDVLANVVQSGLRNPRVGFLLMSVSGLLLIGCMLFTSLQRERVRQLSEALRARLSRWE